MTMITLRKVPPELHKKIKHRAIEQAKTIETLILEILAKAVR